MLSLGPRKYGYKRSHRVAILYRNRVYYLLQFRNMHFRFNGGDLGFLTSAFVGQHAPYCHWVGHPRKPGGCLWNFDSIMTTSWDTYPSGLTAAILDFRLPLTSNSIRYRSTEMLDLEHVEIAVEISLLLEISLLSWAWAEIYDIPYLPPSLIYDIGLPRHRTIFPLVSPCYLTTKTWV